MRTMTLVAALLLVGCGGAREVMPVDLAGSWQLALSYQGSLSAGTAAIEDQDGNWGAYSAQKSYEGRVIASGGGLTWWIGDIGTGVEIQTIVAPAMFNGSKASAATSIDPAIDAVFYLYRPKL